MAKKQLILGIDLGTTFSLASLRVGEDQFRFFTPEAGGDQLVPSVFLHKGDGEICVGAAAETEEKFERHRRHVVRHVKRYMKYNYQEGNQEPETFNSNERSYLPSEISGHILRTLKEAAEREFRKPSNGDYRAEYEWSGYIHSAVITVPAYFGASERQATIDAAKFAGFSPANVELLDEPVAAAISLNLHHLPGSRIILVVDVGGGTTDITLLKVGKNVENGGFFELGRIGDAELGGVDIDEKIVHHAIYCKDRSKRYSMDELDALEDKRRQGPFFQRAEAEKKKVCREMRDKKGVFGEVRYREPEKNDMFEVKFTEQWLRDETEDIIEYCALLCDFLLNNVDRKEAGVGRKGHGISWKQVDQLWMVGGSSLMPHLQERLACRLRDPNKLKIAPRPQHAVAEGAAIYADMLSRKQPLKGIAMPRCPCDIGIMVLPEKSLLQRLREWGRRCYASKSGSVELRPAKKFFPLILSNSLLSDEGQRTRPYSVHAVPGRDGTIPIEICLRFVSRTPSPVSETNLSGSTAGRTKSQINYVVRPIHRLKIPNLPPLPGYALDVVDFDITYEPNHTLHFAPRYRGHVLEPVIVHGGEFDVIFKEKE